jgi:hypothetical protein
MPAVENTLEIARGPLALVALWLLLLAWVANNPEPRFPRAASRAPAQSDDRCWLCGTAYDADGPVCICSQVRDWP